MYLASIYNFAKENSNPLKPSIHVVEGTIKIIIGPIYDKLHDIPLLSSSITRSSY